MDFQRARSQDEIDRRQDEIVAACDRLYETYGYDGVNFKAIAELTSCSRPTIYNYYKTKDEVLLALLRRELMLWRGEWIAETDALAEMSREEFSGCLARSLARRGKMFRLLSILFSSLENNSRVESLADFYGSVCSVLETIDESTKKYFPQSTEAERVGFRFASVSYVLGLHTTTSLSEKQRSAIRLSGAEAELPRFEDLCYQGILALLPEKE